jgi:hypothetical protein
MKWTVPKLTSRWSAVARSAGRSSIRFLALRVSRFNDIIRILVLCAENQTAWGDFPFSSHKSGFTLTNVWLAENGYFRICHWSSPFSFEYRYKNGRSSYSYIITELAPQHTYLYLSCSIDSNQAVVASDVMHCDCSVRWASREASCSANLYGALRRQ